MKFILTLTCLILLFVSPVSAGLTVGTATRATPITAHGTIDGIGWTATTTATSPFLGINLPSGTWNLDDVALPGSGLFVATADVNAGDTQTFVFDQPVEDLCLFIENFDSSSAAYFVTDATISWVTATPVISFVPDSSSSGMLSTTNASFDGVGDVVFQLSGPTTYVQLDYTGGEQANGVFYGFAVNRPTAVPEPSSFLFLMVCGCSAACLRRQRWLKGFKNLSVVTNSI